MSALGDDRERSPLVGGTELRATGLVLARGWAHFAGVLVARREVYAGRLDPSLAPDLAIVAEAAGTAASIERSAAAPSLRDAIDRIAAHPSLVGLLRREDCTIARVESLDRVRVAGSEPGEGAPHLDGALGWLPGVEVFRASVTLTRGKEQGAVATMRFPLLGLDEESFAPGPGEVLVHDLHRELHAVTIDGVGAPPSVLELHFVRTTTGAARWGSVVSRLTRWAGPVPRGLSPVLAAIERHAGGGHVASALALALLSVAVRSPSLWLAAISFVHYLVYLATFGTRERVAFRRFVRDAVFFKLLSMASLALAVLSVWRGLDALALALVVGGFGLASLAARRLGWARTYFGVELGVVAPRRIHGFPYGALPHPMILGAVVGLVGVDLYAPFRSAWPWLVPTHVAFYLVHLAQEILAARARA